MSASLNRIGKWRRGSQPNGHHNSSRRLASHRSPCVVYRGGNMTSYRMAAGVGPFILTLSLSACGPSGTTDASSTSGAPPSGPSASNSFSPDPLDLEGDALYSV